MLKPGLAFCILLASATLAEAKVVKLGADKPVAEITIPDDWKTEASEGNVEVTSPDAATYLSADPYVGADIADLGKDTAQFLTTQKIRVKPETKKLTQTKVADFPTVDISWDATDEQGPTKLSVMVVKLAPDKVVVLNYWRSEAAEKTNGGVVDGIEKSLKAIK